MAYTPTSQQATHGINGATGTNGTTGGTAGITSNTVSVDSTDNTDGLAHVPTGQPNAIEIAIYHRLSKVIDPELGRSITDLGMIAAIEATPRDALPSTYDVIVHVELTVAGCPLSKTITNQINEAVAAYPDATLIPHIEVSAMSQDKLANLVAQLKALRAVMARDS